jgi:hypothetical protein
MKPKAEGEFVECGEKNKRNQYREKYHFQLTHTFFN